MMHTGQSGYKLEKNTLILIPELPTPLSCWCLQVKWGYVQRASWKRNPEV